MRSTTRWAAAAGVVMTPMASRSSAANPSEVVGMPHHDAVKLLADDGRVGVEQRGDPEVPGRKSSGVSEGPAQVADPGDGHRPDAVEAQLPVDLLDEEGGVVTGAASRRTSRAATGPFGPWPHSPGPRRPAARRRRWWSRSEGAPRGSAGRRAGGPPWPRGCAGASHHLRLVGNHRLPDPPSPRCEIVRPAPAERKTGARACCRSRPVGRRSTRGARRPAPPEPHPVADGGTAEGVGGRGTVATRATPVCVGEQADLARLEVGEGQHPAGTVHRATGHLHLDLDLVVAGGDVVDVRRSRDPSCTFPKRSIQLMTALPPRSSDGRGRDRRSHQGGGVDDLTDDLRRAARHEVGRGRGEQVPAIEGPSPRRTTAIHGSWPRRVDLGGPHGYRGPRPEAGERRCRAPRANPARQPVAVRRPMTRWRRHVARSPRPGPPRRGPRPGPRPARSAGANRRRQRCRRAECHGTGR